MKKEEADAIELGVEMHNVSAARPNVVGHLVNSMITGQPIGAYLTLKRAFGKEE